MVTLSGASTYGGGIVNMYGSVSLTGSTVSGNSAPRAAGIYNGGDSATMLIDSSTISGNTGGSTGGGGGIQNDGTGVAVAPAPALTIVDSTIANNTTPNNGGGVDTFDLDASPPPLGP